MEAFARAGLSRRAPLWPARPVGGPKPSHRPIGGLSRRTKRELPQHREEGYPGEEVVEQEPPHVPLMAAVHEVGEHADVVALESGNLSLGTRSRGRDAPAPEGMDRVLPAASDEDANLPKGSDLRRGGRGHFPVGAQHPEVAECARVVVEQGVGEGAAAGEAGEGPLRRASGHVVVGLDVGDDAADEVRVICGDPLVRAGRAREAVAGEPIEVGHDDHHGLDQTGVDQVVHDVGRVTLGGPVDLIAAIPVAQVEGRIGRGLVRVVPGREVDRQRVGPEWADDSGTSR